MKLPATLKPENVTALIDTREQQLLDLSPLRTGVVGRDRERFDREVQRLLAYPVRVLLVEATWAQIELGQWRSKLKPEAVIGSLLGWQAVGLSVHMVGDHDRAGRHAARLLYTVAKRRYRELRALVTDSTEEPPCES